MRSTLSYNWIEIFEMCLEQGWNVWNMFLDKAVVELLVKNPVFWNSEDHSLNYRKSDSTIRESSSSCTWNNNRRFGTHFQANRRWFFSNWQPASCMYFFHHSSYNITKKNFIFKLLSCITTSLVLFCSSKETINSRSLYFFRLTLLISCMIIQIIMSRYCVKAI